MAKAQGRAKSTKQAKAGKKAKPAKAQTARKRVAVKDLSPKGAGKMTRSSALSIRRRTP